MAQAITSRDNERVKFAGRIAASAGARAEHGLLFAEGVRLCLDLAATLRPRAVFFTRAAAGSRPGIEALAPEAYEVSGPVAEKLAGTQTPQGLFALFEWPKTGLETIEPAAGVLLCEAVQDPANVGAMVRSAAGLGFGGVVLVGACADPFSPKALRASMGAVGRIPLAVGCGLGQALPALKAAGCRLYAAAPEDAEEARGERPEGPFALMIGNEGTGLSGEALAAADRRMGIRMWRGVESLNAAAAAAILMDRLAGAD